MKIAEEIARRHYENPYSNWENGIEALTKEIEEYAQEVAKNLHKLNVIKSVCEHKNKRIRNFVFWCDDCKKYV